MTTTTQPRTWQWKRKKAGTKRTYEQVTAVYQPDGHNREGGPRKEMCCTVLERMNQGLPPCEHPATWEISARHLNLVHTGRYCDEHLAEEDCPPDLTPS